MSAPTYSNYLRKAELRDSVRSEFSALRVVQGALLFNVPPPTPQAPELRQLERCSMEQLPRSA